MIDKKYLEAYKSRVYSSFFAENPKEYDPLKMEEGENAFKAQLNSNFDGIDYGENEYVGSEVSPYTNENLGIKYQTKSVNTYIADSNSCIRSLRKLSFDKRFEFLESCLESVKERFF